MNKNWRQRGILGVSSGEGWGGVGRVGERVEAKVPIEL